jgi:hypothetical protein
MAIIQRRWTVRTSGLVAALIIASACTSSDPASASPGCERLNGSFYASDIPGVKDVNKGHDGGAIFAAGDRITAKTTPSSNMTVSLADYPPSDPNAGVTPLGWLFVDVDSFTYTVPAATNHTLKVITGFFIDLPASAIWSCSNASGPRN